MYTRSFCFSLTPTDEITPEMARMGPASFFCFRLKNKTHLQIYIYILKLEFRVTLPNCENDVITKPQILVTIGLH